MSHEKHKIENHYSKRHESKWEKFIQVTGKALFKL
jgi:hypothetical protein